MDYTWLKDVPGAICKPPSRKLTQGRKLRVKQKVTRAVRPYIFARERDICRICRLRPAESMDELRPRSLGGRVSRRNSVALCGSGTTGCHGYRQQHQIRYAFEDQQAGAEGTIVFRILSPAAAEHCKVKVGDQIISPVMSVAEND